jgi:hypothetical protein
MPRIRFLQDRTVDDHRKGTKDEERYETGKVYELSETSCERWVGRGVAKYANEAKASAAANTLAPAQTQGETAAETHAVVRRGTPRAKPTA